MNSFKRLNNWIGWLVFAIASVVYIITSEPTASLWDCGEYIATAYKLQVGHPPGAPFFQLVGKFFSLFASDTATVARMINSMSALSSGFTILFLFWSITHMARKIVSKGDAAKLEGGNLIAVLGSGIVGALAYTFTDSFWFSAVEGEVYAMSSFFTAIVFWAMLKWEDAEEDQNGFRWLVLIAYLVGLSIGVHLLNLLTIPALVYIYYFKKYPTTTKGIIISGVISIVLLALIMYGIIPWIVILAGIFEKLFVNSFGMPFHSGTIVYFTLLIAAIIYGLYYTHKKQKLIANTIILGITFLIIGYSSFFILVVRSNANTPIDENNPEDATSMLAYLNREQYGDRPLFSGPYFNAPTEDQSKWEDKSPVYSKFYCIVEKDKLPNPGNITLKDPGLIKFFQSKSDAEAYITDAKNASYSIKQAYVLTDKREQRTPTYDKRFTTFFPRMWSNQRGAHASVYKEYMGENPKRIRVNNNGTDEMLEVPSFVDNMKFFFGYQVGHMYMRYFMWNFVGRQNDLQGHGEKIYGNWVSGIPAMDNARLGDQSKLPIDLQNNRGTNHYYFLPLILGLAGLYFHLIRNYKDGIVVISLFLMTGLAIVVYLNQYPYQPRERDYAYVASFYAFAIWIGLGVLALYEWTKKYMNPSVVAIGVTAISFLAVPALLAQQNWDDHDRSGRYNTLNVAKNYLNSCAPNSILFTNGDNDTFPLWYAQEVEGIRTDIKIVNLSLFNTDWYADQMRRKTYNAEPIPMTADRDQYIQGTNDMGYFIENPEIAKAGEYYNLSDLMNFFFSSNPKTKFPLRDGTKMNYFPTKLVYLSVDKQKVLSNGTVALNDSSLIVDKVKWKINENLVQKNNLMMMDMLATFNWDRPIYFAITTGTDAYLNLMEYFQMDGMAYRLVPIKTPSSYNIGSYGRINTDTLFDKLVNVFRYDDINNPNIYFDEHHMRSIRNYRSNFARLADELVKEGKYDKAKIALDKCMEALPEKTVPYDYFMIPIAENYMKIGEKEKGTAILNRMAEIYIHNLKFYYDDTQAREYLDLKRNALYIMQEIKRIAEANKLDALKEQAEKVFTNYYQIFTAEQGNQQ
jgi:hypothetical protein